MRLIHRRATIQAALLALAVSSAHAQPRAFPGAEGFGAESVGGRGGRVIEVTNLNDSGPGSLRAAIDASGPRIVAFRVGGTILLRSGLEIRNPYITVAGQTAPGGGITLRNDPSNGHPPLSVRTNDVVIRYLRLRPGANAGSGESLDAVQIGNPGAVYNVVIDHCSLSWAVDEVANPWYDARNVVFQWNIIAEGLDCSTHPDGCHSKGMIVGSDGSHSISIHHNLFAHNAERNPRIRNSGIVDVVNNVIYNPGNTGGWGPSHVSDESGAVPVNYVANFLKPGVDSGNLEYLVSGSGAVQFFVKGNITPGRPRDDMAEIAGVVRPSEAAKVVSSRFAAPAVSTTSAAQAYEDVLEEAGASAHLACDGGWAPRRDSVDLGLVSEVRNGTGRIIDSPSEVGGWPVLSAGTPCTDSDGDGMPDEWEVARGFRPTDATDGAGDADRDGYTNLEEYLNGEAGPRTPLLPPPPPVVIGP